MKLKKLISSVAAMAMVGVLFLSPVETRADEVSNSYEKIKFKAENTVGQAQILTDEDLQAIAKAAGASWITNDGTDMITKDTVFSVDWDKSEFKMEDIWRSDVCYYWFTRDESGKLVLERSLILDQFCCTDDDGTKLMDDGSAGGWNFFFEGPTAYVGSGHVSVEEQYKIADNMNYCGFNDDDTPDLVYFKAYYPTQVPGNTYYSWVGDFYIFNKENSIFHFKEQAADTPSTEQPTDTPSNGESYVLDVSNGDAVISKEAFDSILQENQTKDVVIKSNNDITFTFKKGTMKAVDGKDSYDFSTTISREFGNVTGLPSQVTRDNFVQRIDYNYSGELPAEASIRLYVGKDYAGKILYYSHLLNDTSISLVQSAVVDADGYISVAQSHCSSYIVTNTELKTENNTVPQTANNTDSKKNITSPKTGDDSMIWLYAALAVSSLGILFVARRKAVRDM